EPSPVIPTPFYPGPGNPAANDGYNLLYSFDPGGVWDDHDTNNVMPFVDSMALYCQTNSTGSGTNVFDLAQGAQDWIDSVGLSGKYTVNVMPVDAAFGFDQIRDEVLISQDVILLLGFYEDVGGGYCEWIGGHFVTVAGTCTDPADSALCISDPYFDMHEGEPPAGSAHGSSVHNDAANISGPHGTMHHDRYTVIPNQCQPGPPPVFDCELFAYGVNAGNVPVWFGQNIADTTIDPIPPQGGPIHTIIEYAVVICPDTTPPPTGACCEPPYGLCHIMTQFSCDSAGWFYEGDGTTCTPNPCDSCDYQNPGDVDNDGNINVADIAYLISFLYKGGPAPPVMANADPNGDCCIDYRDVLYLIQFVFFAGPPPVNCTCVDPPVCIPAPGTYVPGIVKHNTDGYLPTDGSPIGTSWHELFPGYCENWVCSSWVDNGDGILSYCDTLDFYHPVYGVKTLEHVELVTPTIELINTVDPFDTLYLDLIDPPNATCTTITEPIGTRWHEVYPQYCHQFMIVYHAGLNMGPLAVSDMIIIQSLNGADSGSSYDTYMVADIDCDIVTTPLITLGDEYDHNVDGYSPYDGSPEGTLWQELYPNFDDMWIVDKWIDNGDGWLGFCDTIKVVGQDPPHSILWKHVKEVTFTLTCTDPANDTFYFDYRMVNPMYPWSSAPVGTFWHELYPTFSQMTMCINWIDNGTGFVDFCDSLDLEYVSGPDSGTVVRFHVESIDWDMVSTIEEHWDPPPPMDGKVKHNLDGYEPADGSPVGTQWHELWYNYCELWDCDRWFDNGDGILSHCDTVVFKHIPTGRLSWEHVLVVTPTITVSFGDSTWYLE
ncbi:MAG: dockerin type I repeat-containing protein, partial [candidate division Zixibacteria bacterium]|nr:dockerin type I repeat-containing protein [candidate division Zixibacteria bacterium]